MPQLEPAAGTVDLNADLGEGVTDDAGLLAIVTSANVACGYHAGNREIMKRVCAEAVRRGVSIGAQVSYADRANFGRVPVDITATILAEQVRDQVGTLAGIALSEGGAVRYLKPHGALYHRVIDDEDQAGGVLFGSDDLPVLGFPGASILRLARLAGRTTFTEAFPDRAYTPEGRLQSRSEPGAVLVDPAEVAGRSAELATGVDSVCVHGDSISAVETAAAVRRALAVAGWILKGL